MALTLREKEHWEKRITERMDLAIEELQAEADPEFYQQICEKAEGKAWASLGIHSLNQELKAIDEKVELLNKRQERLSAEMFSRVTGRSIKDCPARYCASHQLEIAVHKRKAIHVTELMQADQLGSKLLRMRGAKEHLLDTVWLAPSTKHIEELWTTVTCALQQESVELLLETLDIDPADSASRNSLA